MSSVLLVDPEPNVLTTLKMVLERDHYRVRAAASYVEASALLHSEKWEVLITELDVDDQRLGLKLAGEAKNLESPPAVFVYTSFPDMERLRAALALRVDYCAFKPMEVEQLRHVVRLLVVRRSASRVPLRAPARR